MLTKKLFQFKNIKTTNSKTIMLLQFYACTSCTINYLSILINYSIVLFTEFTAANTDTLIINCSYAKNEKREIHSTIVVL